MLIHPWSGHSHASRQQRLDKHHRPTLQVATTPHLPIIFLFGDMARKGHRHLQQRAHIHLARPSSQTCPAQRLRAQQLGQCGWRRPVAWAKLHLENRGILENIDIGGCQIFRKVMLQAENGPREPHLSALTHHAPSALLGMPSGESKRAADDAESAAQGSKPASDEEAASLWHTVPMDDRPRSVDRPKKEGIQPSPTSDELSRAGTGNVLHQRRPQPWPTERKRWKLGLRRPREPEQPM